MATENKKRPTYFRPLELEILLRLYSECESIIRRKSNTAAAEKEGESSFNLVWSFNI